ncbi:MAG: hypothetical protein JWM50_1026 [Microbacteriaceae bacterium]|nr:hypothetical protein [Microbacteriaceae bacterium]
MPFDEQDTPLWNRPLIERSEALAVTIARTDAAAARPATLGAWRRSQNWRRHPLVDDAREASVNR